MPRCRCANCGSSFQVPAGEHGDHKCPKCGGCACGVVAEPGLSTRPAAPEEVRNPGPPSIQDAVVLKADDWMQVEGGDAMICGARYAKLLKDEAVVARVRKMMKDLREQNASVKPDPETWGIVRDGVIACFQTCLGENS